MSLVLLRRAAGGLFVGLALWGGAGVCEAAAGAAAAGWHVVVATDGCTAVSVYTNASGAVYAIEECNGTIRHIRMSPRR